MNLGVSYNIFDGGELLEFSINSIRSNVDFISVVYQDVSNLGNSKPSIHNLLLDLKSRGLVDEIIKYVPNLVIKGHGNEVAKRNIGLESCIRFGCDHFMSMDCDEFYKNDELKFAKDSIILNGHETTACQMQTYYFSPEYAITPPETYYVPLISKIDDRRFGLSVRWPSPISADPTRRLDPKKLFAFGRVMIEMHHMSYVRKDIRAKLNNSSANPNFINKVEALSSYHDNWTPVKKAQLAGIGDRFYDTVRVENYFGINI